MTLRVTLVGAGIVGAAAADQLARFGARVTLVDAGVPGRATSATSLSWVNANSQPRPYFDFRVAAMRAWTELAAEFGEPAWYQPSGNLAWATDADGKAELHERVERLRDWDYPATVVTPSRANELEPQLRIPAGAAIAHFPSEGWVDGAGAVDALTDRALAHGATVAPNDGVVAIDTRAGCAATVRLASGGAVEGDVIVCCAGWRSGEIAQLVGAELPLVDTAAVGSRAHCAVATTVATAARPSGVVHGPNLYLRPTAHGGVWLEASDVDATVDRTTTDSQLQAAADVLLNRARAVSPALGDTALGSVRRCIRPLPDDGLPIVGSHPSVEGLYVAVTHSGITLAAQLGLLIAEDLLHGDAPALNPYRPDRFTSFLR